jgi:L,D-peptidoglycan transpeptidase YkuD (ErfK/YbiS/YcfS/YnhG family)
MIIQLKNKENLKFDEFMIKCSIGKNGTKKRKLEGDKTTPKGTFRFLKIYYRKDRVKKPLTRLKTKIITRNMGWCNDPKHKKYNQEIIVNKNILHEKLYRKDNKYNYLIVIDYNIKKTIPYKGSAIFLHLTNNYSFTEGCVAVQKKDFLVLCKLLNKNSKIKIN